jgi:outer membrane lipoprotein SlyB
MSSKIVVLALCGAAATSMLAGCAADNSSMVYSQNQMQQAQTVQIGTVTSVEQVKMRGNDNQFLTLGGAALGGIAGSTIGQGRGSAAGAVVGALAGGFGAQAAQNNLNTKPALRITVKLDDSKRLISIVQDADISFSAGQRVRIMSGNGTDRVVPY